MPAQIEFPNTEDYEKFGKLVKKWATDPSSRPTSRPQDLQQQLDQAGVNFSIPPEITTVKFVTWDDNPPTLTILLPPAKAIKDADDLLRGGQGPYHLPVFYSSAFGGNHPNVDLEKFNAQRIGEYCINQCQ